MSYDLLEAIRARFCHVDACPLSGTPRIFFENAGGALTLRSVVETTAFYSALPDNQGRPNRTSQILDDKIARGMADVKLLLGTERGTVFMGETGTELLFRLVRNAQTAALQQYGVGNVVGSALEHPATRSAMAFWAERTGHELRLVHHDPDSCLFSPEDYAKVVDTETRVATIIWSNPVAGTHPDVQAIVRIIRERAPDCLIIVDGIQYAAHGSVDLSQLDIDGFALSAYKIFSRHNYGVAWVSPRLEAQTHEQLDGAGDTVWSLGTRDASAWISMSDVVNYLEWLGATVDGIEVDSASDPGARRQRLVRAGEWIHGQEANLLDRLLNGSDKRRGLKGWQRIQLIGGAENPARSGLVSFAVEGMDSRAVVEALESSGVRTHVRKADHFSGNVLAPLGLSNCVRLSFAHYNTLEEVDHALDALAAILENA